MTLLLNNSSLKLRDDKTDLPKRWHSIYWLYAALIPGALYIGEVVRISLYHVYRAPNVNLITHLMLLFLFYGVWAAVPRLIWLQMAHTLNSQMRSWKRVLIQLTGLGLLLSSFHIFLLTILKLITHATASWAWAPIHILHAYGENWLGYFGQWLMVYIIASIAIVYVLTAQPPRDAPLVRYEVKENGKTLLIPIADIYWVKAAGNYAELHTARGLILVRKTLAQVDNEIGTSGFIKSHRGALLNSKHVLAIIPREDGGGLTVQLTNGETAPLSRRKLSAFKQRLKKEV